MSGPRPDHLQALNVLGHELRRPLTVVRGAATLLLDAIDELPAESRAEMLGMIDRGVEDMAEMVEDMLVAVHLEAGDLRLELEQLELEPLVEAVCARCRRLDQARVLRLELEPGLAVRADPAQAARALRCLLENAYQHAPEGELGVAARAEADGVRVWVWDRGPGIAAGRREEAWSLFGKLDPRAAGSGLGLYLARGVARAMGGEAGLEDGPGGGLRVWFTLRSGG